MTSIGTVHRGPAPRDGPRYTSTATASYRRADLVAALRAVGIAPGDAVFFHVCADTLGTMVDAADGDAAGADALLAALREAVGDAGTLLVPSYTFAFCRQEVFDVRATPSVAGMWSTSGALLEGVRRHAAAVRSRDPIHAIAGIGPLAHALLDDVPATCFGPDCVHDRLRRAGGKVCTIGVGLHEAAFRHHVEEMVGAPFRYKKLFTGRIRDAEGERPIGWVYSVRILAEAGAPDGRHLEALLFAEGCARAAGVGLGEVQAVDCASF
jgi:aminoglycoside 3-N-acetyltransferase